MDGIVCLLREAADRDLYESYTAQCLWSIANGLYGLGGHEFSMPQYVELIHPELKKNQQTAQEIKDYIYARITEV